MCSADDDADDDDDDDDDDVVEIPFLVVVLDILASAVCRDGMVVDLFQISRRRRWAVNVAKLS
jgi:hypothetical protein